MSNTGHLFCITVVFVNLFYEMLVFFHINFFIKCKKLDFNKFYFSGVPKINCEKK